jgi:hypothetical protein
MFAPILSLLPVFNSVAQPVLRVEVSLFVARATVADPVVPSKGVHLIQERQASLPRVEYGLFRNSLQPLPLVSYFMPIHSEARIAALKQLALQNSQMDEIQMKMKIRTTGVVLGTRHMTDFEHSLPVEGPNSAQYEHAFSPIPIMTTRSPFAPQNSYRVLPPIPASPQTNAHGKSIQNIIPQTPIVVMSKSAEQSLIKAASEKPRTETLTNMNEPSSTAATSTSVATATARVAQAHSTASYRDVLVSAYSREGSPVRESWQLHRTYSLEPSAGPTLQAVLSRTQLPTITAVPALATRDLLLLDNDKAQPYSAVILAGSSSSNFRRQAKPKSKVAAANSKPSPAVPDFGINGTALLGPTAVPGRNHR